MMKRIVGVFCTLILTAGFTLLGAGSAAAATPGSSCTLTIRSPLLGLNIVEPGRVDETGSSCVPPVGSFLVPTGFGVTCGTTVSVVGMNVRSNCPN
jgi:hypothetical protein